MKQRISRFSLSIALIYPFSYGQAALLEMMMEAAYNYAKSKLTMLTAAGFNPKIPISIGFIFSAYFVPMESWRHETASHIQKGRGR